MYHHFAADLCRIIELMSITSFDFLNTANVVSHVCLQIK